MFPHFRIPSLALDNGLTVFPFSLSLADQPVIPVRIPNPNHPAGPQTVRYQEEESLAGAVVVTLTPGRVLMIT
ncbi:hypothetical protein C8R46DRAFT_1223556 [Mycena filopes]|nr:hypothetical protein C8R46DRAFT_1223556 [Mycena filopes]